VATLLQIDGSEVWSKALEPGTGAWLPSLRLQDYLLLIRADYRDGGHVTLGSRWPCFREGTDHAALRISGLSFLATLPLHAAARRPCGDGFLRFKGKVEFQLQTGQDWHKVRDIQQFECRRQAAHR